MGDIDLLYTSRPNLMPMMALTGDGRHCSGKIFCLIVSNNSDIQFWIQMT